MFSIPQRLYGWLTASRIPLYERLGICVLLGMAISGLWLIAPSHAASTVSPTLGRSS